jgi:peroxiredoxin
MKNRYILVIVLLLLAFKGITQENYRINFEFDNYNSDTLLIAYFYADRQLIQDTVFANDQGEFIYAGQDTLAAGVYILMFFPERDYIQFIVNNDETFFTIYGDYKDLSRPRFKGSRDNEMFYSYLDYIKAMKGKAQEIGRQRKDAVLLEQDTTVFDGALDALDQKVLDYQDSLINSYPGSVTSTLILGNRDIVIPDFEATGKDLETLRFYYYRNHFFEHIDLGDPVALRTPFLHNKLERYLDNLTVQMPDSIMVAVDYLLKQMEPSVDTWKFYVAHFLNKYGKSQYIGMDAVYVHMVDTYYAKGRTPWADQETLDKIIDNANKLRPVLIGKTAPDVTLFTEDGQAVRLHEIESPYIVLMFWAPDCGHCKTSMPALVEFNEQFKDKGIKTIGICTKHMEKTESCWEFVKEKNMEGLYYNLADQYHKSRFQVKYNVRTTPQVFVLDKDKKIVLKRIAVERLSEVMADFLKRDVAETQ